MPIPDGVIPTNIRRIELTALDGESGEWVGRGQAWVDEDGRVQGDTEHVDRILEGAIPNPNVLTEPRRTAIRDDGAAMLYGLCLEALNRERGPRGN